MTNRKKAATRPQMMTTQVDTANRARTTGSFPPNIIAGHRQGATGNTTVEIAGRYST